MSKQEMTAVEIHNIGRCVWREDFEALTNRVGTIAAELIWDTVAKCGMLTARNGLVYLHCVPLINRE